MPEAASGLGLVPIVIEQIGPRRARLRHLLAACCASASSSWSGRSTTRRPTWSSRRCCSSRARTRTRTSRSTSTRRAARCQRGLAIYDTMQFIKPDVSTLCMGMAASMGAFLLAAGAKGKRFALPNSRVMIHQPLGRRPGPGHRHRDPRARDPQDARAAEQDPGRAHRPAAREDRSTTSSATTSCRRGRGSKLRPDRPGARQPRRGDGLSRSGSQRADPDRTDLQQRPCPTRRAPARRFSTARSAARASTRCKKLIAGPSVFICDECIELCNDIIRDESAGRQGAARRAKSDLPTPQRDQGTSSTST